MEWERQDFSIFLLQLRRNSVDTTCISDVDNIDFVFNYDFPNSCEDYIHRIGRTARGGKTGTAVTMLTEVSCLNLFDLNRQKTQGAPKIVLLKCNQIFVPGSLERNEAKRCP